jgi:hypothetical protein
MGTSRGAAAPEQLRAAAGALVIAVGEAAASQRLGICRQSLLRLIAGLPIRPGTIALAEQRLAVSSSQ